MRTLISTVLADVTHENKIAHTATDRVAANARIYISILALSVIVIAVVVAVLITRGLFPVPSARRENDHRPSSFRG